MKKITGSGTAESILVNRAAVRWDFGLLKEYIC